MPPWLSGELTGTFADFILAKSMKNSGIDVENEQYLRLEKAYLAEIAQQQSIDRLVKLNEWSKRWRRRSFEDETSARLRALYLSAQEKIFELTVEEKTSRDKVVDTSEYLGSPSVLLRNLNNVLKI